jgi:hypothetical protein
MISQERQESDLRNAVTSAPQKLYDRVTVDGGRGGGRLKVEKIVGNPIVLVRSSEVLRSLSTVQRRI